MKHGQTRQKIISVADDLFYRRGYDHTSFSDITEMVGISRGNLYHHFKIKDDILDAVIEKRLTQTQINLEQWDSSGKTPMDRIKLYIQSMIENWSEIMHHGCPVGSLCNELSKLRHASLGGAVKIMDLFRRWLKKQFIALQTIEDPNRLAMDLLSWGQGVAMMTTAFKDIEYAKLEVERKNLWLAQLATRQ